MPRHSHRTFVVESAAAMGARLATPAVWLALMSHQLGRDLQSSDGLAQDVAGRCHSDGTVEMCSR